MDAGEYKHVVLGLIFLKYKSATTAEIAGHGHVPAHLLCGPQ